MTQRYKEELIHAGADVETTIKRFMGKEEIYEKFLRKFPKDANFVGLGDSIKEGRYTEAFKYAHTLKGVTANLGLDPVMRAASDITELTRNKDDQEVDRAAVADKWDELQHAYAQIVGVIESYADDTSAN